MDGALVGRLGTSVEIAVSRLWRVPPRFFRSLPLDRLVGVVPPQQHGGVPPPRLGLGRLGGVRKCRPFRSQKHEDRPSLA